MKMIKVSVLRKDTFDNFFINDKGIIELEVGNEKIHIRVDLINEDALTKFIEEIQQDSNIREKLMTL
jgi:hypothetical protein